MFLARFAVEKRVVSALMTALILGAGYLAYEKLPCFEDPEFIIRQARIITPYPGASAAEVTDEVTGVIENAVQQLTGLKEVRSVSSAGLSEVTVEFTIAATKTRPALNQKFTLGMLTTVLGVTPLLLGPLLQEPRGGHHPGAQLHHPPDPHRGAGALRRFLPHRGRRSVPARSKAGTCGRSRRAAPRGAGSESWGCGMTEGSPGLPDSGSGRVRGSFRSAPSRTRHGVGHSLDPGGGRQGGQAQPACGSANSRHPSRRSDPARIRPAPPRGG